METATSQVTRMEIWHKVYNLEKRDNLSEIPDKPGVFGIFGIIDDEPVNCRYVGESENLRNTIMNLFEQPTSEGLKKFMQGSWIKMLQYELIETSEKDRKILVTSWIEKYKPGIDTEGDYPGYYGA